MNESFDSQQQFPFIQGPNQEKPSQIKLAEIPTVPASSPPKCHEILCPKFSVRSANFALIAVFTVYYVSFYIFYLATGKFYGCALYEFGAKFTSAIRFQGHVHRLLVPILLFGGWVHFCISILTLLLFGFNNESFLGRPKYLLILVNGGVYGTLLSAIIYPYRVTTTNVSLIFTLLMLQSGILIRSYQQLGQAGKYIVTIFILVAGTNFLYMFDSKSADIGAILGGTLFGGSIAFYLFDKPSLNDRFKILQKIVLTIVFLLEVALIALLFTIEVDFVDIGKIC